MKAREKIGRRKKDPLHGTMAADNSGFWSVALKRVRNEMLKRGVITADGWTQLMQRGDDRVKYWSVLKDFATTPELLRDPLWAPWLTERIAEQPEITLWFLALLRTQFEHRINPVEVWLAYHCLLPAERSNKELCKEFVEYYARNGQRRSCSEKEMSQAWENIQKRVGTKRFPFKRQLKRKSKN